MPWYLFALIVGVFVMPWLINGKEIILAFKKRGPAVGFGYWSGLLWLYVPLSSIFIFIGYKLAGA